MDRRGFVEQAALALCGLPLLGRAALAGSRGSLAPRPLPPISVFSKHLQFLDYPEMAAVAARIGFDGVDLTVRPGGHVEPAHVERDLPRAFAAIEAAGLRHDTITTAVEDATRPLDRRVLEAAAAGGARYYRMNWYSFRDGASLHASLDECALLAQGLGEINQRLGLVGCYQNHAGLRVGASIWEIWRILEQADPATMGFQYDIRHATVEGGLSWPTGLRLAAPRIKTLVLKDFKWVERDGRNELVNTPLGRGTVDFVGFFRLLEQHGIHAPISMHLEHPVGGAERGARELSGPPEVVYQALAEDLAAIKRLWAEA
jgi:sugar phosphate isomerase/epimerase